MTRSHLPLNALRAFEASARHLSFTRAGLELRVSQAAVSQQVKGLEAQLGAGLFRRLPRGLALTDEGAALLPVLSDVFARVGAALDRVERRQTREVVTLGCNGTFATGWLLPHLGAFEAQHPLVDLRLLTNNNRVDAAGDGLDFALRFGDGLWHGTEAAFLVSAPLSVLCAPDVAARLRTPGDLIQETLLRSYRADEWPSWFAVAGLACPTIRGPIFDSSVTIAAAAAQGVGVALLPVAMFRCDLETGRLARPFGIEIAAGAYWLTWPRVKPLSAGMYAFRDWLTSALLAEPGRVAP